MQARYALASLIIACCLNSVALGQAATNTIPADDLATIQQRMATLESSVSQLEASINQLSQQLAGMSGGTTTPPQPAPTPEELHEQIKQLDSRLTQLFTTLDARLSEIGREVNGQYISDVIGNMSKSPAFQRDMQAATQGKLVFHNNWGIDRLLYINGTAWSVRPGTSYIWVPATRVSIQTVSNGAPSVYDNWQFNGSHSEMEVSF